MPETGRTTLNLLPESMLLEQSAAAFNDMKTGGDVLRDRDVIARIQRIGDRVLNAARQSGNLPPSDQWEFVVFDDDEVINAFAMPGGKVGVYTGIIKITDSDDELAAIIGHEIAHVSARHGNERMSQAMLIAGGGVLLNEATREQSEEMRQAILLAYGLGATLGAQLPYSRLHENEADHIGLIYMARAGYDPRAAPEFWRKMSQLGGSAPPEFLSTHPASENRVKRLEGLLPEVMPVYEQNRR